MKQKSQSPEQSDRGFDSQTFWRHYVATVDTDQEWSEERPQPGRRSNRLFLFLLLFHIFLIGSVVLFNLVAERPKPVFIDNSAPKNTVTSTKKNESSPKQTTTPVAANGKQETVEHRVILGDSLKSIAAASGVTQEEIAKMNQIDVNTQLAVGSVLQVPKPKAKASPSGIPAGTQPSRVEEKLIAVQTTTAPASGNIFKAVEPAPVARKTEAPPPPKAETVASKLPEDKPKAKAGDSPPSAPKPKVTSNIEESPPSAKPKAKAEETPPSSKPKATDAKALVRTETPPAAAPKPTTEVAKTSPPAAPKTTEPAKPAVASSTAKPAASSISHTVKPKETFYSISRKYGVKVEDLMRLNGFTNAAKLREGIVLKVPAKA